MDLVGGVEEVLEVEVGSVGAGPLGLGCHVGRLPGEGDIHL